MFSKPETINDFSHNYYQSGTSDPNLLRNSIAKGHFRHMNTGTYNTSYSPVKGTPADFKRNLWQTFQITDFKQRR